MTDTLSSVGSPATPVPDIVIAKFAPGLMSFSFVAALAIFAAGWMALLDGTTLGHAWAIDKVRIVILLLATFALLWAAARVLGQMVSHGGRAIWTENGTLRYTSYGSLPFSSLPVADIQGLSVMRGFLRPARIAIRTKTGGDLMVTSFLSVPADVICARLAEALALPKTS